MHTNYQLNNQSISQQSIYPKPIESLNLRVRISLAVGIIVALGGLFLLLAACKILPKGMNAISRWHVGNIVLSSAMIGAGAAAFIYGLFQAYQSKRMLKLYNRLSHGLQAGEEIPKEELVEYLSIKIRDGDLKCIKDTFSKLDLESQGMLFAIAAEENRLCEMVDVVPKNVNRIKFHLGNQPNFDKACELVDKFVLKLNSFTQVDYIVLDLSGIAYYSDGVHNHTEQMLKEIYRWGDVNFGGYGYDTVARGGLMRPNNAAAAHRAINGLLKFMKNNSITSATIQFKDHSVTISKVNSLNGLKLMITKISGEVRNEDRSYT